MRIGLIFFIVVSFLIGCWVIIHLINLDNMEREKLKNHKIIEAKTFLNSTITIDRTYKGYIYVTAKDKRKYIIGPTRVLSGKKIFESISNGDSLVKLVDSDTLFIFSKFETTEKFILLF